MIQTKDFQRYARSVIAAIVSCSLFSSAIALAQDKEFQIPDKDHFHLYLLAGQSNMAGRGEVDVQSKIPYPRVLMLDQSGKWVPARDPVHYDKPAAGVGPGRTFAAALTELDDSIVIGLIPAACGGSSITTWVPGGYHDQTHSHPYDDAIARTRRAMEDGTLKAILWHQGESDSKSPNSEQYKERLITLIQRFREEFQDPGLPFVIGQLGQFPGRHWNSNRRAVDQAQREVAEELYHVGFVSSDGLSCLPDKTHFNTESQREFGRRYAAVYMQLIHAVEEN
ncbi:sialate O-acetylesterase [Coraliomargarita parva]|uniref:sialate O-acetylesterase n=1 Tax=Coraliomargarita parva TaxID=3014050 RepID=UPI0022B39ACD|nr:sialate O-acetylesterase [Coraliomargarita parva]